MPDIITRGQDRQIRWHPARLQKKVGDRELRAFVVTPLGWKTRATPFFILVNQTENIHLPGLAPLAPKPGNSHKNESHPVRLDLLSKLDWGRVHVQNVFLYEYGNYFAKCVHWYGCCLLVVMGVCGEDCIRTPGSEEPRSRAILNQ
jgi:hypothetical protein